MRRDLAERRGGLRRQGLHGQVRPVVTSGMPCPRIQLLRNFLGGAMTRVLEIPLDLIQAGEARPNEWGRIIHDRALHYFRCVAPMFPAVSVRIEGDSITLVRGTDYLDLARDLGMSTIRSVVAESSADAIDRAKGDHGLAEVDPTIELDALVPDEQWHVFVFDTPITSTELAAFQHTVLTLFGGAVSGLALHDGGGRLEFYAPSPFENREWTGDFIGRCKKFSDTTREIVSYQGRLPPWQPWSTSIEASMKSRKT